jgi:hypothetical protein
MSHGPPRNQTDDKLPIAHSFGDRLPYTDLDRFGS